MVGACHRGENKMTFEWGGLWRGCSSEDRERTGVHQMPWTSKGKCFKILFFVFQKNHDLRVVMVLCGTDRAQRTGLRWICWLNGGNSKGHTVENLRWLKIGPESKETVRSLPPTNWSPVIGLLMKRAVLPPANLCSASGPFRAQAWQRLNCSH